MAARLVDARSVDFRQLGLITTSFFFLPTYGNKPMCVFCLDKVALVKSSRVKRHLANQSTDQH